MYMSWEAGHSCHRSSSTLQLCIFQTNHPVKISIYIVCKLRQHNLLEFGANILAQKPSQNKGNDKNEKNRDSDKWHRIITQ